MDGSDIQHIFPCPRCGAQNVVGQVACQYCEQRFQYNCPYCGHAVDPTLVNCPSCRGPLNWPTPQRVKAFPKQRKVHAYEESTGFDEEQPKQQKKRDPWLMGCVVLIILVVIAGIAIWVLDMLSSQRPPSPMPAPYPASGNQTGSKLGEPLSLETAELSDEASFYDGTVRI